MLLFFRNETGFGGNNGFTDFKRILGMPLAVTQQMRMTLFVLTGARAAGLLPVRSAGWLPRKFGRVLQAIRDAESRVMFSATTRCPTSSRSGRISAVMCGVAGRALRAPGRHHQPGEMSPPTPSRSRSGWRWRARPLIGPIVGAFIVNGPRAGSP